MFPLSTELWSFHILSIGDSHSSLWAKKIGLTHFLSPHLT